MTNGPIPLPRLVPTPVTQTSRFSLKERLIWHRQYPDQGCWTSYEYLAVCAEPIKFPGSKGAPDRWFVIVATEADSYRAPSLPRLPVILVPTTELWHIVASFGDSYNPLRDGGPGSDVDIRVDDAGSTLQFPVCDPAAPPVRKLTAAIACRVGIAGRRAWIIDPAGDLKPGYRVVSEPHPRIDVPDPTQANPYVGAGTAHITVATDRAWFGAHQHGRPVDPASVASLPFDRVFID